MRARPKARPTVRQLRDREVMLRCALRAARAELRNREASVNKAWGAVERMQARLVVAMSKTDKRRAELVEGVANA
jgi:hypothetical protein